MAWLYYIAYPIVAPFFRTIFKCWSYDGKKNIPKNGAIFASNHNSNAEGVVLNAIQYRPIRFLGKSELFQKCLNGLILRGVGTIPIERGNSDEVAFANALNALKDGKRIGIFPEGTRGNGKRLQQPHTGVIRLSLMANVPIVPVGISGGTKAWPKGKGPRFFKKVRIKIGKPWYPGDQITVEYPDYNELKRLSRYLMFELIEPLWDRSLEDFQEDK